MLSLCLRSKIVIGREGLVFALEDINACVACVIICESDVVIPSSEARSPGWSPKISVYLISKMLSWWG